MSNHLGLGPQGRCRGNDTTGHCGVIPRVPMSSSQPLADPSVTLHPALLQLGGKVGTRSLSHGCHLSGPWLLALLACHVPHPFTGN